MTRRSGNSQDLNLASSCVRWYSILVAGDGCWIRLWAPLRADGHGASV